MIMGDIDANQFKNLTFNLIPSPAPRNYGTRVAIDTSRLSVTYRYTITEPDSLEATVIDMQALEIGDMLNRFYSRYGEFRDSIMYENHLGTPYTATCSHTQERTPAWCRNAL